MVSEDQRPEVPKPRIGDAERDDAVTLLQEHMAAGRLDQDEFTGRMNAALQARTMDELAPLFRDLPGRRPGQQVAVPRPADPVPTPASSESARRRVGTIILALLWPAAILFNILTGFEWWWTWLIPVFGSGAIATAFGLDKNEHHASRHQGRHDHRRLRIEQRTDRWDRRRDDRDE